MSSTSRNSMPAVTPMPSRRKMRPRTSRWCFTRTPPPRTAGTAAQAAVLPRVGQPAGHASQLGTKRQGRPDFTGFADKNCFQLNDTHPAIAVPELMRILIDEHGLDWDDAWEITRKTDGVHQPHAAAGSARDVARLAMFRRLLPRLLDIIYEINARFISEVNQHWPATTTASRACPSSRKAPSR